MSDIAIRVENLGKRYRIGAQQARYQTLRDSLVSGLKRLRPGTPRPAASNLWALKDVSFEVRPGEVIGVIGRNGAGKSTLLKVLSHITRPTTGRVEIHGRVGSLLEVGTGFHPELTGRDNIYLNGAVLGMKRAEIDRKFEEIVAFAEVEKMLDTAVKHYSSGMYMRLAFSVAAHLEPEILLVDEVLAVGDAAFQKKCLGKMGEVAKGGRTVLFVSHSMPSIELLCNRVILLDQGQKIKDGETNEVVRYYINSASPKNAGKVDLRLGKRPTVSVEPVIEEVWLENHAGEVISSIGTGDNLTICFRINAPRPISNPDFGFGIEDEHGKRIVSANNMVMADADRPESIQSGVVRCKFSSLPLQIGQYFISISVVENMHFLEFLEQVISFSIEPVDYYGTGRLFDRSQAVVFLPSSVRVSELQ